MELEIALNPTAHQPSRQQRPLRSSPAATVSGSFVGFTAEMPPFVSLEMPPPPPPPPLAAAKSTARVHKTLPQPGASKCTGGRQSAAAPPISGTRTMLPVADTPSGAAMSAATAGPPPPDASPPFAEISSGGGEAAAKNELTLNAKEQERGGGHLEDCVSIHEFVEQYDFSTERLERVVFELEEAGRLNQVVYYSAVYIYNTCA